jgi:hypothetical protein
MARSTIMTTLCAEHRRQVRLEQLATRHVVAAVHGAAGNKKAGSIANAIDFLRERVRKVARTEDVMARFGPPLIPPDEDRPGASDAH